MATQQRHSLCKFNVIRQCHSTFSGSDDFYRMEAEHSDITITAVSDELAAVFAADSVGCILDDFEAIALRQFMDCRHVAGLSAQVHCDYNLGQSPDCLGLFQFGSQGFGAQVVSSGIYVDKIDPRPAIQRAVGRGYEGNGGGPEPIARPEP
ncbi:hypothetical protein D9M71_738810 [compost metagenome]